MSDWNFMSYGSKDNLLEAIRRESAGMFALAEDASWEAPTGAGHWQVRDVFGHVEMLDAGPLTELAEPWRPFRSVATWYFWRSRGGPIEE